MIEHAEVCIELYDFNGAICEVDKQALASSLERMIKLLGPEKVIQLGAMIDEIRTRTGYGDVKIVLAEGFVSTLKQEISYK